MTFEPKYPDNNVNVPHQSHGREFIKLAAILTAIVLTAYLVLGFIAEAIVMRLPPSVERTLGQSLIENIKDDAWPQTQTYAQTVLDRLIQSSNGLAPFEYRVSIVEDDTVNAIALPAGHMVLFTGLLKEIDSENELAMILAHELGHYAHKDHLRGLGRGLVLMAIATFFSASGQTPGFLIPSVETLDMRFSREQEQKADLFGLNLVVKAYGHAGGVLDVYDILAQKADIKFLPVIFSSHPDTLTRKQFLERTVADQGYSRQTPAALPPPGRLPIENNQPPDNADAVQQPSDATSP